MTDLFVISISTPIKIGIYEDTKLIKTVSSEEKTSDSLPKLFNEILKNYTIDSIYFINGPGSFMAIKASYIFLKTLSIIKGYPLFASDGFAFNNNQPIKAHGTSYFMKENGKIYTVKLDRQKSHISFDLPETLDKSLFHQECEPLYILPAV
ncbi:MAG: hypothetical protein DSZ06_01140 [Sulfurospirillum sp.]|nr:MAG: hypothetical protein DSZ06_01140 [Sulfurospirillum sp.]